jgi:hypothetical protein
VRPADFFYLNVVFVCKTLNIYALPVSHLKVHAAIEQGLAGEQSVFADSFALDGVYFAIIGSIHFLQLHGLSNENSLAC